MRTSVDESLLEFLHRDGLGSDDVAIIGRLDGRDVSLVVEAYYDAKNRIEPSPDSAALSEIRDRVSREIRAADDEFHFRGCNAAPPREPAESTHGTRSATFCRNCGSNDITYVSRQIRSADEGMTTFATCVACAKTWRM